MIEDELVSINAHSMTYRYRYHFLRHKICNKVNTELVIVTSMLERLCSSSHQSSLIHTLHLHPRDMGKTVRKIHQAVEHPVQRIEYLVV